MEDKDEEERKNEIKMNENWRSEMDDAEYDPLVVNQLLIFEEPFNVIVSTTEKSIRILDIFSGHIKKVVTYQHRVVDLLKWDKSSFLISLFSSYDTIWYRHIYLKEKHTEPQLGQIYVDVCDEYFSPSTEPTDDNERYFTADERDDLLPRFVGAAFNTKTPAKTNAFVDKLLYFDNYRHNLAQYLNSLSVHAQNATQRTQSLLHNFGGTVTPRTANKIQATQQRVHSHHVLNLCRNKFSCPSAFGSDNFHFNLDGQKRNDCIDGAKVDLPVCNASEPWRDHFIPTKTKGCPSNEEDFHFFGIWIDDYPGWLFDSPFIEQHHIKRNLRTNGLNLKSPESLANAHAWNIKHSTLLPVVLLHPDDILDWSEYQQGLFYIENRGGNVNQTDQEYLVTLMGDAAIVRHHRSVLASIERWEGLDDDARDGLGLPTTDDFLECSLQWRNSFMFPCVWHNIHSCYRNRFGTRKLDPYFDSLFLDVYCKVHKADKWPIDSHGYFPFKTKHAIDKAAGVAFQDPIFRAECLKHLKFSDKGSFSFNDVKNARNSKTRSSKRFDNVKLVFPPDYLYTGTVDEKDVFYYPSGRILPLLYYLCHSSPHNAQFIPNWKSIESKDDLYLSLSLLILEDILAGSTTQEELAEDLYCRLRYQETKQPDLFAAKVKHASRAINVRLEYGHAYLSRTTGSSQKSKNNQNQINNRIASFGPTMDADSFQEKRYGIKKNCGYEYGEKLYLKYVEAWKEVLLERFKRDGNLQNKYECDGYLPIVFKEVRNGREIWWLCIPNDQDSANVSFVPRYSRRRGTLLLDIASVYLNEKTFVSNTVKFRSLPKNLELESRQGRHNWVKIIQRLHETNQEQKRSRLPFPRFPDIMSYMATATDSKPIPPKRFYGKKKGKNLSAKYMNSDIRDEMRELLEDEFNCVPIIAGKKKLADDTFNLLKKKFEKYVGLRSGWVTKYRKKIINNPFRNKNKRKRILLDCELSQYSTDHIRKKRKVD